MRVALIITELYPGGAERCCANLACFLQAHGHQVGVWQLGSKPLPGRRELVDLLERQGIPWHSGSASRAWHLPRVVRWLRGEMREFQPDIVQAFLFHANLAAVLAARHLGCSVLGGVRVRQPERWRQRLQGWAARHMQRVVCVSDSVARHCQAVEKIRPEKIVVIPNGIDWQKCQAAVSDAEEDKFGRLGKSAEAIPANAPVLLFAGRLTAQKGIEELMRSSMDNILKALPRHHWVVMGDGRLAGRLAEIHSGLACRERVHLIGWQPHATAWMRRSQLLVLPARYEGMPNVLLEAMAVGTPLVSFDVEGVRELVGTDHLADAQIVPAGDFARFQAAVLRLAQDQGLRDACIHHNRQRIIEHFQLDHQLQKYLALYRSLTAGR